MRGTKRFGIRSLLGRRHLSRSARRNVQAFHRDLDQAWGSQQVLRPEVFTRLGRLPVGDAAQALRPTLLRIRAATWQHELAGLGVITGRAGSLNGEGTACIGVWRSDRPVLLVRPDVDFGDPVAREDLGRSLGELLYGIDDTRVAQFASLVSGDVIKHSD